MTLLLGVILYLNWTGTDNFYTFQFCKKKIKWPVEPWWQSFVFGIETHVSNKMDYNSINDPLIFHFSSIIAATLQSSLTVHANLSKPATQYKACKNSSNHWQSLAILILPLFLTCSSALSMTSRSAPSAMQAFLLSVQFFFKVETK